MTHMNSRRAILEMGMLLARLGRARVAILKKGHIEQPSDTHGILYLPFNAHVRETVPKLSGRLAEAGFELSPNDIATAGA
jgi:predicted nucleotide-binding protein